MVTIIAASVAESSRPELTTASAKATLAQLMKPAEEPSGFACWRSVDVGDTVMRLHMERFFLVTVSPVSDRCRQRWKQRPPRAFPLPRHSSVRLQLPCQTCSPGASAPDCGLLPHEKAGVRENTFFATARSPPPCRSFCDMASHELRYGIATTAIRHRNICDTRLTAAAR